MGAGWRSRRIAATRSAATTTSGCSTLRTGELRQLTKDPSEDFMPTWSPDDREIAFASTRESGQSIWAVSVAESHTAQGRHRQWRQARRAVVEPRRAGALPRHGRRAEPLRSGWQAHHRHRERVRLSCVMGIAHRLLLRVGREDPEARALARTAPETVAFTATLQVTQPAVHEARARLHVAEAPQERSGSFGRRSRPTAARSHSPPSVTSTSCPSPAASR